MAATKRFDPFIKQLTRIKVICESAEPPFKFDYDILLVWTRLISWISDDGIPLPEISISKNHNNENCLCFSWKRTSPVSSELHILFNEKDETETIIIINDKKRVFIHDHHNTHNIVAKFYKIICKFLGLDWLLLLQDDNDFNEIK